MMSETPLKWVFFFPTIKYHRMKIFPYKMKVDWKFGLEEIVLFLEALFRHLRKQKYGLTILWNDRCFWVREGS